MYKVEVSNKGGSEVFVKAKEAAFTIDTDGKTAAAPLEVLLASLGSCMSHYIRRFARTANIQMDSFALTLEAELAKDKGYYFKDINVTLDLKSTVIDDMRKTALAEFVKNCPVHNTIKNNPNINLILL